MIDVTRDGGTAIVTVDRPEALNALDVEHLETLHERLAELAADETARVVVLTGGGEKAFIAGADIKHMQALSVLEARRWGELGHACGALLATSAVAKGLFHDDPWSLDVSGGFASPLAAELIQDADLIVGWGCALNMWTMRHGRLIGPDAVVAQVDLDADALGAHRDIAVGVVIGEMFECEDWRFPEPAQRGRSMEDVFRHHLEPLGVPVVFNLPLGHGAHLATIPLGARATVDAGRRRVTFEETGLSAEGPGPGGGNEG